MFINPYPKAKDGNILRPQAIPRAILLVSVLIHLSTRIITARMPPVTKLKK